MMRFFLTLLVMAGLAACHNSGQSAAPPTTRVDSAVAAAPDTIRALPPDSGRRADTVQR